MFNKADRNSSSAFSQKTSSQALDNILLIGMDGDEVCELMQVNIDAGAQEILIRSLKPLFRSENDDGCPEATYQYKNGGAAALTSHVSRQIDSNIEKYVLFTYQSLMQAADLVGGLNLAVGEEEIEPLNRQIEKLCPRMGLSASANLLRTGGDACLLNGLQAAAFLKLSDVRDDGPSRIRCALSALKKSLKNISVVTLGRLGKTVLSSVRTNIPTSVLLGQIMNVRDYMHYHLKTL